MYTISLTFSFCYAHRLWQVPGRCQHLHGHNVKAVVYLEATQLDSAGMVKNFDEIKKMLGTWIAETLDHRVLLSKNDPLATLLEREKEPVVKIDVNPTAENVAQLIFKQAQTLDWPVSQVEVWETENNKAGYRE